MEDTSATLDWLDRMVKMITDHGVTIVLVGMLFVFCGALGIICLRLLWKYGHRFAESHLGAVDSVKACNEVHARANETHARAAEAQARVAEQTSRYIECLSDTCREMGENIKMLTHKT